MVLLRTSRAAFTLIELMVVIAIIAIMIGGAGFMLGGGFEASERATSVGRQLTGLIESSAQVQRIHKEMAWIEYDFENQIARVYHQVPLDDNENLDDVRNDPEEYRESVTILEFGDPENPENSAIWLERVVPYEGREETSGVFTITFDPAGSLTGHIVHIRHRPLEEDGDDEYVSVDYNPLTGLAAVYTFQKELEKAKDLP